MGKRPRKDDFDDQNINKDYINEDINSEFLEGLSSNSSNEAIPGQIVELRINDGYIKRRAQPNFITYYKYDKSEKNASDYYRTILILYTAWRNEKEELLNVHCKAF